MRKVILFFSVQFVFVVNNLSAQPILYGLTTQGGEFGRGTVSKFETGSNKLVDAYAFSDAIGISPRGSLLQANDGKLYGMTGAGGTFGDGTVFSFDPATDTYNKLHDFDMKDGSSPRGSLVQASDGKLYGMTYVGGSSGFGTIFSFDPGSNTFDNLHDFNNINGGYPNGSLVQAGNGKLYGMTHKGGTSDAGIIFSFDPVANTFNKLHDFFNINYISENGSFPYGSLVLADNGKLYGMTYQGGMPISEDVGITLYGTIFSFDPVANIFRKLHEFDEVNGSSPYGDLVQARDGKLYGMTYGGGSSGYGTIFSLDPVASTFRKLHDFNITGGRLPGGSLVEASDGKLYGITSLGGSSGEGTIFSFDPATNTYNKRQDYNNINGTYPTDGTLIEVNSCTQANYYEDSDQDGYGNPAVTIRACTEPPGYVVDNTDCNDSNSIVHPGATELCNSIDDDCNGQIDEAVKSTFYADADGDGFGNPALRTQACAAPPGYVVDNTDCNDSNIAVYPGANEVCNGIDDDCDGQTDEGEQTTFYADSDGDGYGNAEITTQSCSKPAGYVRDSLDCDDNNSSIHPGAPEVAGNNIDDDCNGVRDEGRIVLWPNPARQSVNLRIFDATFYGSIQIDMVDKNGRIVKNWIKSYNGAGEEINLQIAGMASGIYIVIIKANNGSQLKYKLAVLY